MLLRTLDIEPKSVQVPSLSTSVAEACFYVQGRKAEFFKELPQLKQGSTIYFATVGKWSSHELLAYLLSITGPADVGISTYSMTEDPARLIVDFMSQGIIRKMHLVSDKRFKTHQPNAYQLAIANFPVFLTDIHAKVMVIRNEQWDVVVLGSANFTRNKRREVGCIVADSATAAFYDDLLQSMSHATN